jgi:hypothetical protein
MAVIEHEPRTTSAEGNLTFVVFSSRQAALLVGAGDEPQPAELIMSDDELVQNLLATTEPLADGHFVD